MRFLFICVILGFVLANVANATPSATHAAPAAALPTAGTEETPLTLDAAIVSALANNFTIAATRYEPQITRARQISAAVSRNAGTNQSPGRRLKTAPSCEASWPLIGGKVPIRP